MSAPVSQEVNLNYLSPKEMVTCALQNLAEPIQDSDQRASLYGLLSKGFRKLGHFEDAGKAVENGLSLRISKVTRGHLLAQKVALLIDKRELQNAVSLAEQSLISHPFQLHILFYLGRCYRLRGQFADAENLAKIGIDLPIIDPVKEYFIDQRINALFQQKKWDSVILESATYMPRIQDAGIKVQLTIYRGFAFIELGKKAAASLEFTIGLVLNPSLNDRMTLSEGLQRSMRL